jgi:hypothetical protein
MYLSHKCCSGNCNKPLAIGCLSGYMARYTSSQKATWKTQWASEALTWIYNLQDSDELLDEDFTSLRNGKIDCVILGDHPTEGVVTNDVVFATYPDTDGAARIGRAYFPTVDSDEETALFEYLARGGTVIVKNTFPRYFEGATEHVYSADKQTEMATFLSRVGSSSTHVMAEDLTLPSPVDSYYNLMTSGAIWSVNPDNVLGHGTKRNRVRSYWRQRMLVDIWQQTGRDYLTSGSFTDTATDLSAGDERIYVSFNSSNTPSRTFGQPIGKQGSKLVNNSQESWYIVAPMASVAFGASEFDTGTHDRTTVGSWYRWRQKVTGYIETNGNRLADVIVTAEQLPDGGNLVVMSPGLESVYGIDKTVFRMILEAITRRLSNCENLAHKSFTQWSGLP